MKQCIAISTLMLWSYIALAKEGEMLSIDPISGLVIAEHYEIVRAHCSACHSAKLVTQNRLSRDNWLATIRWMQQSQGLWSLGEQEAPILDYLERYYSPLEVSRRPPIPSSLMPNTP